MLTNCKKLNMSWIRGCGWWVVNFEKFYIYVDVPANLQNFPLILSSFTTSQYINFVPKYTKFMSFEMKTPHLDRYTKIRERSTQRQAHTRKPCHCQCEYLPPPLLSSPPPLNLCSTSTDLHKVGNKNCIMWYKLIKLCPGNHWLLVLYLVETCVLRESK